MQRFFSGVPIGVWAGVVVVLLAAWARDGWGFVLGAVIIIATSITTAHRSEDEDVDPAEVLDDGWGTDQDTTQD